MASARKCDICGKFYTVDSDHTVMTLEVYSKHGSRVTSDEFDICTECTEKILNMKEPPSKEVTCATCDVLDLNCHEQCKEWAK